MRAWDLVLENAAGGFAVNYIFASFSGENFGHKGVTFMVWQQRCDENNDR
jgi:hypothetical protein